MEAQKVLVVDDSPTDLHVITGYLANNGYETVSARNGEEALLKANEDKPDLILMDVQMPGMDGLEATRKIRSAQAEFRNTPIIALTAYAMSGDREKFLRAGMDGYLAKPVDNEDLLRVLARHLGKR